MGSYNIWHYRTIISTLANGIGAQKDKQKDEKESNKIEGKDLI